MLGGDAALYQIILATRYISIIISSSSSSSANTGKIIVNKSFRSINESKKTSTDITAAKLLEIKGQKLFGIKKAYTFAAWMFCSDYRAAGGA